MTRLATATFAVFLFLVPVSTTAWPGVAMAAAAALALAALGIVTTWRWPIMAAACLFATDYTAALWIAKPPVSIVTAAAVGVALLLLLQSAELSRCLRHATIGPGLVRAKLLGWLGLAGLTVATAMVLTVLARLVAGTIPFLAAPVLAAVGALGVVLALAGALTARYR